MFRNVAIFIVILFAQLAFSKPVKISSFFLETTKVETISEKVETSSLSANNLDDFFSPYFIIFKNFAIRAIEEQTSAIQKNHRFIVHYSSLPPPFAFLA